MLGQGTLNRRAENNARKRTLSSELRVMLGQSTLNDAVG
jgi:hypothetical protein